MRILTVVDRLGPGGTQRAAQTRSIAFAERGHDVAVLAYDGGGPRLANLQAAGLPAFVGGEEEMGAEAIKAASAWGPELLHVHRTGHPHPRSASIVRTLREARGERLKAIEVNHFGRVDRTEDRTLFALHLQLSRWCLWKFNQWARGLRPKPVGIVCPHLMNAEAFFPAGDEARRDYRRAWGMPDDAFVFGRVGQPSDAKWHPIIFDAFARVARTDDKVWMMLIGSPESYGDRIAALPAQIAKRIVRPDFMHGDDKLRACYAAMDVFLHAAYIGESFGQVFGECQLCGVPVITLSTPLKDNSQLESVGHMRGGIVVNDLPAMQRAMITLKQDDALRARLATDGAAYVKKTFDVPPLADRLLRASEAVLESDSRARLIQGLHARGFETEIPMAELTALLRNSWGPVSMRNRLGLRAVHQPIIYGAYHRLRRLRG